MKKLALRWTILTVILATAVLLCTGAMADTVASGTCGTNLTWTLDNDGLLTISGTGAMTKDASSQDFPWYPYATVIQS